MDFPYGTTVYRLRPKMVPDPYNPGSLVPGSWDDPDELEIPEAVVLQASTALTVSESREEAAESKSLHCPGSFDIRKGDRIRVGPEGGPTYTIDGIPPEEDTNPWTGWSPPREIPLTRYEG